MENSDAMLRLESAGDGEYARKIRFVSHRIADQEKQNRKFHRAAARDRRRRVIAEGYPGNHLVS